MWPVFRRIILGILFVFAFGYLVWIVATTSSFKTCVATQTIAETPHALSLANRVAIYSRCGVHVMYEYREAATAVATAFIALFTLTLWWSTRNLWNVTRIEAEHIPRVERAYVSGGATGIEGSPEHFAITVDNYGKTPAFIGTIWANIVPEDELPDTPVYDQPEFGWFGGQMLKPQTSGHPTVVRLWDVVEGRVIYGRIWYRDIFKQCHSAGFILRILGPGRTIAVANRDAYWEDRDEPDLGPAAGEPPNS